MEEDDQAPDSVDSLLAAVARIPVRTEPDAWTPPPELDEYRLIRPLGRGGMGSVWLAEDRLLDRLVAVKFIAHDEPDAHTRERFVIEARAAARLSHVNVVTVHRYGEITGRPYLVSEYIRGESLDKLAKPVPWERALELGVALARGLAAAHRHGIVHRDIKPANAILTVDGDAKLVDFGLARLEHTDRTSRPSIADADRSATSALTAPGTIAGTPRYLAPEVRRGEVADRRADIYGIGCILYELVIGRAPVFDLQDHSTEPQLADGSAAGADGRRPYDVPSIVDRIEPAGARFAAVVDRCLAYDPDRRYGSGDELREALEQLHAPAVGRGELPDGNPYRGLVPFEAEHRALFFGRGSDIRAVLERLRADPFVLVTGDSGTGKSSLCRAGVLPELADGAFGDGLAWTSVQLVPGQRPVSALASLLAAELGRDEAALAALCEEPRRLVRELRRGLGDGARKRGLVVFVDQLEELCTIADPGEAGAFAAILAELAAGLPGLRVLATVRSDFLTRVAELPALGGEIARAIYLLRPLTPEGAREAVVGPALATGVRFESDALVETLVGSAASGPNHVELPLLAFTLAQLWDARDAATQTITEHSLEAIGGVRGALARHADGVLTALLPDQRVAARKLLLRLVTPERTRARRSKDELAAFDGAALDALVRGRLVVARGSDDTPSYELAHERLIDGWPTLAGWLSDDAEALAVHARLAAAVATWERLGRAREALWGARQLAAPLVEEDLTPQETAFVGASRRALRRRTLLRWGAALAAVLIPVGIYAGARVITRRDLDRHVAANVADAEAQLAIARAARDRSTEVRATAFASFDAGELDAAEARWEAARKASAEAEAAYVRASRALEAALLLDTARADVTRALAELTYERIQLAARDHRETERSELLTRLGLYDDGGLAARLAAPAQLELAVEPSDAALSILSPGGAAAALAPTSTQPPGSYVVVATASGRTPVRAPVRLESGQHARIALALPPAGAVPPGFVYVPAGRFLYGSRDAEQVRRFFGAAPMHARETGAYLIATTEVTYAQWIEFLDALPASERTRHAPRIEMSATVQAGGLLELARGEDGWQLRIAPAGVTYEARAGAALEYRDRAVRRRQDWLQFPVSGVSSEDALAYVAWLDRTGRVPKARLCTEVEWERAARGADGRTYPHGERLAPDDANIDVTYGRRDGGFGLDVVGAHPASTSPFGLVDASGNVWEITRTMHGTGYVMRGGGYFTDATSAHLANRQEITPEFRHLHAGLRVCADP